MLKKCVFIHGDSIHKNFDGHDIELYPVYLDPVTLASEVIFAHDRFGTVVYCPNEDTYVWGDGGSAASIGDVLVHDPDKCSWRPSEVQAKIC